MEPVEDVSGALERSADQWLAWARTPDHDAHHWRFNFPQFAELLPEAPRTVLDLGCGEGRGPYGSGGMVLNTPQGWLRPFR